MPIENPNPPTPPTGPGNGENPDDGGGASNPPD